jgi:hypothetical protein
LLEAIGALAAEEKRAAKSKSAASAYQDAATESFDREADEEAAHMENSTDSDHLTPESLIGAAVFKVSDLQKHRKQCLLTLFVSCKLRKIICHSRSSPQRRRRWQEAVETALPNSKLLMLILGRQNPVVLDSSNASCALSSILLLF